MTTTDSSQDAVLVERQDGVIQLTLNAPHKRNSLQSPGVYEGLMAGLDELERDPQLRAAIITGSGGAFCSGGDLRSDLIDHRRFPRRVANRGRAVGP